MNQNKICAKRNYDNTQTLSLKQYHIMCLMLWEGGWEWARRNVSIDM